MPYRSPLSLAVVVPAFNAAATIRRALDSVLRQHLPPTGIVVVDDGSTDGTAAVVAEYGARVRSVTQPNAGASAARNRGIAACDTEWVAFLDADDEWLPAKLGDQLDILDSHRELAWCFGHMESVRGGRALPLAVKPQTRERLTTETVLPFFDVERGGLSVGTSGAVVARRVFAEVGGFDPARRIAEDRDLWWRIARHHPLVGYAAKVGWRYYLDTPGSLMKVSRDRSDGLRTVCDHLAAWRAAGQDGFETYGRGLALDYLLRSASGEIDIADDIYQRACALIRPSVVERLRLRSLRYLPARVAQRVNHRWS